MSVLSRLVRAYFEGIKCGKLDGNNVTINPYVKSRSRTSEYQKFRIGFKAGSISTKWIIGDRFKVRGRGVKVWRVHRTHGRTIWYLPAYYGFSPPRGVLRKASKADTKDWMRVED